MSAPDKKPFFHRLFDATSQWLNVAWLNGNPNESISGRAYRKGWRVEHWLDAVLGAGHCMYAYDNDVARARQLLLDDFARPQPGARHGGL